MNFLNNESICKRHNGFGFVFGKPQNANQSKIYFLTVNKWGNKNVNI